MPIKNEVLNHLIRKKLQIELNLKIKLTIITHLKSLRLKKSFPKWNKIVENHPVIKISQGHPISPSRKLFWSLSSST